MAVVEQLPGVGVGFAKAVEDGPEFSVERLQNLEGGFPCVPFVDDHIESEFGGECQLFGEYANLCGAYGLIGLDGFLRIAFGLREFGTGQVVMIQTHFAESNDSWMGGQYTQFL